MDTIPSSVFYSDQSWLCSGFLSHLFSGWWVAVDHVTAYCQRLALSQGRIRFTFRKRPQALQSTKPSSFRRQRGVVLVEQFWHIGFAESASSHAITSRRYHEAQAVARDSIKIKLFKPESKLFKLRRVLSCTNDHRGFMYR